MQCSSKASLYSLCIQVSDGHYSLFFVSNVSNSVSPPFQLLPPHSIHPFFPVMAPLPSLALCSPTSPQVTSSRAAQHQQSQSGAGSGKNSPPRSLSTEMHFLYSKWIWRCNNIVDTQTWHGEILTGQWNEKDVLLAECMFVWLQSPPLLFDRRCSATKYTYKSPLARTWCFLLENQWIAQSSITKQQVWIGQTISPSY